MFEELEENGFESEIDALIVIKQDMSRTHAGCYLSNFYSDEYCGTCKSWQYCLEVKRLEDVNV